MLTEQVLLILVRLAVGSVATFLAILAWSRTRDTAWIFVVIAMILQYGEIVFTTLELFGLARAELIVWAGVPLVEIVLHTLPLLCLAIAFAIVVARRS